MCNIKRWNIFWMDRVFDNIWVSFNFPILSSLSFHLVCLSSLSSVVLIFFPSIKCLLFPLPKTVFLPFVPLFSSRYHSLLYPFTYEAFLLSCFHFWWGIPLLCACNGHFFFNIGFHPFLLTIWFFFFLASIFWISIMFCWIGFLWWWSGYIFLLLGLQNKGSWLYALLNWILNGGWWSFW